MRNHTQNTQGGKDMLTVFEFLLKNEQRMAQERLAKLEEMKAPEIMVQGQRKLVAELEKGNLKIGGDQELLKAEFETFELKKGSGGKGYIQFDNGIKYFPQAKYGRFITR